MSKDLCGDYGGTNSNGDPCGNNAGQGTDHAGQGYCYIHDPNEDTPSTGRPNEFEGNDELKDQIIEYAREPITIAGIARAVGKSDEWLYSKLRKGEQHQLDGKETEYSEFFARFTQARAQEEIELVQAIKNMRPQDLKWLLSTSFGYKKVEGMELTGKDGEPLVDDDGPDLSNLSTEELKQFKELRNKIDGNE